MDVGRSISYVFQDQGWLVKVLIGGLLSLIPIFGWFVVLGYWIRIAQNVSNGYDVPLPEWNDFGGDFMRGLKAWVAVIVWAIPFIIILACVWIPVTILGSSSNSAASALGVLVGFGGFTIDTIIGIAIAFITPVIIGRVVQSDSVSAAFNYNMIINDARQNPVPLLIIVGMSIALRFVASFGIILCFVGYFFTSFLSFVMLSHLYGQYWRQLGAIPVADSGTINAGPTI